MKNLFLSVVIFLLCFPLVFTSCQGNPVQVPVPTADLFSTFVGIKAPDGIILTPGGPSYVANTSSANITNQWPPVEYVQTVLAVDTKRANVAYREYLETRAGETRNNIINVFMTGATMTSLSLYAISVPQGITLTDGMQWSGPLSKSSVLVIGISQNVSLGKYSFKIGLKIDGVDYGALPCTIKVIK